MPEFLSPTLQHRLKSDHEDIIKILKERGYEIPVLPVKKAATNNSGEVFSLAYPIQGLLKYHGMSDKQERIAYFPSISLNNDIAAAITYLKFDKNLKEDTAYLNGKQLMNNELNRIKFTLDMIRNYSDVKTKALVISRNVLNNERDLKIGKGLGTSASGGAAISKAAFSILYDNNPEFVDNSRLISIFSRYLAASATRSAVGGLGLWFSHPTINPMDCFAIRLDTPKHQEFINNISVITVSIESELKTEMAHDTAPESPFFIPWLETRKEKIIEFVNALEQHDFNKIGELSEYDTQCLHAITMTSPLDKSIIAWYPKTLEIMRKIRELRENGINAYYTIDTGPSVVILTEQKNSKRIMKELSNISGTQNIYEGNIGGPAQILPSSSKIVRLLDEDLQKFNK